MGAPSSPWSRALRAAKAVPSTPCPNPEKRPPRPLGHVCGGRGAALGRGFRGRDDALLQRPDDHPDVEEHDRAEPAADHDGDRAARGARVAGHEGRGVADENDDHREPTALRRAG